MEQKEKPLHADRLEALSYFSRKTASNVGQASSLSFSPNPF
jgi:hypothetical protein